MCWTLYWKVCQSSACLCKVYIHKRLHQFDSSAASTSVLLGEEAECAAGKSLITTGDMHQVDMLVAESASLELLSKPSEEWQLTYAASQAQLLAVSRLEPQKPTASEVANMRQAVAARQEQQLLLRKAGKSKLSRYELLLEVAKSRKKDSLQSKSVTE